MRKVIAYLAASIDGFIARSDGRVDWMDTEADIENSGFALESFLQKIDTILMGRKSYEQAVSFGKWPYQNLQTFVFSQSMQEAITPNTTIVPNLTPDFVNALKKENGKDIWLFGGGVLNHFFLHHNLINEIQLFVQPVLLGNGIGIFGNQPVDLKEFSKKESLDLDNGFTLLRYTKK